MHELASVVPVYLYMYGRRIYGLYIYTCIYIYIHGIHICTYIYIWNIFLY
jgi:hypothetical protein